MRLATKKILKLGSLLFLLGCMLFVCNELFIRDWRGKYSEERVKKSIRINFEKKQSAFDELKEYLSYLNIQANTEIEFLSRGKIRAILSSPFMTDSIANHSIPYGFISDEDDPGFNSNFELSGNGLARIETRDTIIETHNWNWVFEGAGEGGDFDKLIAYMGVSKEALGTLRHKIEAIDCEAVRVHYDNGISVRFDGFNLYQYEYYFPSESSEVPPGYIELADGIYAGLYDSGLVCVQVIFRK